MDVSPIFPNLAVGSCPIGVEDVDRLRRDFGITAVLNVQSDDDLASWDVDWNRLQACYRDSGIEVRRVPVQDFDRDDFRRNLHRCVEVLDELLRRDHVVYVHCNMGVNRSPSIVIAYLHWIQRWELERAARYVMACRSCDPYLESIRLASADRKK